MKRTALRRFRLRWFPPAAVGKSAIPTNPGQFDLFLLAGQSNMAGFGCVREADRWCRSDFEPRSGIFVLGGQGTLKSARPRGRVCWRPAAHPLHLNQNSAGFGLGLPFAEELRLAYPQQSVGLVPCAWGGVPIACLQSGSPLFENMVARACVAARRGRLRAVLWHQGESDAESNASAAEHAERLKRLMADFRGAINCPQLPFLIGDLAEFAERRKQEKNPDAAARWAQVRAGLRKVAENDPFSAFVESRGLTGVDGVHFGRDSLIEFGRRYARVFHDLR
ncbi:MAG: sialate O-acetylesterase [Verrucomicrobiales bacterium]